LLDIFSTFGQSFLPYGAPLLLAGSITKLSPFSIIPYLHYQMFLLGVMILFFVYRLVTEKADATIFAGTVYKSDNAKVSAPKYTRSKR
jgi:Na+/H+ antiporter NhaC